jgi:recombination protein RecA
MVKKLRVNEESDPYGMKVKVYVAKNKIAPQWRNCELTYLFGKGFSAHFDYFELARKAGAIVKSGSWLSFKEFKAQGDLNFVEAMEKNEDLFNGIKLIVDGENLAQRAVDAQPDEIPESLDLGMEESEALPEAV